MAAFEAIQARYDAARVWVDLGEAALAAGHRAAAAAHWEHARRRFVELHVPRWAERAEALARTLDASV